MRTLVALILLAAAAAAQSPVGVLNATQFSGADVCAQINAAYAALPNGGGTIVVPAAGSPAGYQCTTPVLISTPGKYAMIKGVGGTKIQWLPTTGTMFTFNAGGVACCNFAYGRWGLERVAIFGSGGDAHGDCAVGSDASTAVFFGGQYGAQGAVVKGVDISCFDKGVVLGENTWGVEVSDCMITDGDRLLEFLPGLTNAGESVRFIDTFFTNNIPNGSSTCQLKLDGQYFNATFTGDSFDGVQVCTESGINTFFMPHFEDVAGNMAIPFLNNSTSPGTVLIAPQFSNTSGQVFAPSAYVENSGMMSIWGWNSAGNANQSACIYQEGPGAMLDAYAPDAIVPGCDAYVSGGGTYAAEVWPGQFDVSPPPLAPRPPRRLIHARRRYRSAKAPALREGAAAGAAAARTLQLPLRSGGAGFTWIPRFGAEVTLVRIQRTAGSCAGATVHLASGSAVAVLEAPASGAASWGVSIPVGVQMPVTLTLFPGSSRCEVEVVLRLRR